MCKVCKAWLRVFVRKELSGSCQDVAWRDQVVLSCCCWDGSWQQSYANLETMKLSESPKTKTASHVVAQLDQPTSKPQPQSVEISGPSEPPTHMHIPPPPPTLNPKPLNPKPYISRAQSSHLPQSECQSPQKALSRCPESSCHWPGSWAVAGTSRPFS